MVDIAGNEWSFVIVHGRQFFDGEEYLALIDPAPGGGGGIRISDTVPLGEQLELAAGAALAIFLKSVRPIPVCPMKAGEGGRSFSGA